MGFFGHIAVARTHGPYTGEAAAVLHETDHGDGWWWIQFDGEAKGLLTELVAATGAPVITAYVLDSDVADVTALTPAGERFHTYLHAATAEQMGAPALTQTPAEVLRAALTWSAEAGLIADPQGVEEALTMHSVFAEETFDELVTALGVPVQSS